MININGLTKQYGEVTAIDGLTFDIADGSIVGFLGPNGAGKSTTMRILCAYMPATSGTALINGVDVAGDPFGVKKMVGYLPEDNPLYGDMTPVEYLSFCASIRGMDPREAGRRIKETVDICGLGDVLVKPVSALSKGYRQRVGIAQAILHDPPVLILDEPTSGLDPNQIQEIRNLITSLKGTKSIILSTHIMQEVQAICERVIIIDRGRIVADGSKDELMNPRGRTVYHVQLDGPAEDVRAALAGIESVGSVAAAEFGYEVDCPAGTDPRKEIFRLAVEKDWPIMELKKVHQNLEEVFRSHTIKE